MNENTELTQTEEQEVAEEKVKRKTPPGVYKRVTFDDGGFRPFEFTGQINEAPEFKVIARAMGYDPLSSEVSSFQNYIADIARMIYTYLQTDDVDKVNKFVRQLYRKTPQGGSRIINLKRTLQLLLEEEKE